MNWTGLTESFEQVWRAKPGLLILLLLAFIIFAAFVIDTRIHRKRHGRRRRW
ncbi:MAG TPA: hypothetical protein VEH04_17665 [Verrucomicrobiae bacterium]|nr:hypothetical protein [Verrucomicrobiae bacterium]